MPRPHFELLIDAQAMTITVDWNDCPVGLQSPQPDWLIENGGSCFCRCISHAPHDVPKLTNYKCKHFIGLIMDDAGMNTDRVYCSYK